MEVTRKRKKSVLVRMDEKEYDKYLRLVKKSKLSQQNYNLRCMLKKNIYVIDGIQELAMQIRKMGVNINQVVHLANENNTINKNDVESINLSINEVWKILLKFVEKVKK
ncbi:MAG: plasmid mobilization relaxosome protein MobC [Clostridium sp.]|uniref:plasmid mobilization protein n=1 Tax=Clostridium TaxID=1485 RepID=UPI002900EC4C|nr:plasmid mobilization relaxosome protein MobC [Clostridium sp.]MDU1280013.1 plasmid mobilization relaxosome protein MobC [Clostridium sp.]MDU7089078.1 plasmid mobilization relaxosome protein MobC [Clostridium sp.]